MSQRSLWILGLLGGIAGCTAHFAPDGEGPRIAVQVACKVNVQLDENGDIIVDHEPVRTKRCAASASKKTVFWKLTSASGYKFGNTDGITFPSTKNPSNPGQPTGCGSSNGGTEFSCEFPASPSGYKWSYMIKLVRSGYADKSVDPTVIND